MIRPIALIVTTRNNITVRVLLCFIIIIISCLFDGGVVVKAQSSIQDPNEATIADKWRIVPDPHLEYNDAYGFLYTYTVSNFIDQGQAGFYIYDKQCRSSGGSLETFGFNMTSSQIIEDVTPGSETNVSKIEMSKNVSFFVEIIADDMALNDDLYVYYSPGISDIFFCVVFYLTTPDGSLEVSAQETEVTLKVNMTHLGTEFELKDIYVKPKDRTETEAELNYAVEGFLCNAEDGTEILSSTTQNSPFLQGQVISVCIRPDSASLIDGVRMEKVNEFEFTRTDDVGGTIVQKSISDGTVTDGGLTDYTPTSCANKEWCSVSTMLYASFFQSQGSVTANGVASIQFSGAQQQQRRNRNRRHHRERQRQRALKMEDYGGNNEDTHRSLQVVNTNDGGDDDQTIQPFEMNFDVLPTDENDGYDSSFLLSGAASVRRLSSNQLLMMMLFGITFGHLVMT